MGDIPEIHPSLSTLISRDPDILWGSVTTESQLLFWGSTGPRPERDVRGEGQRRDPLYCALIGVPRQYPCLHWQQDQTWQDWPSAVLGKIGSACSWTGPAWMGSPFCYQAPHYLSLIQDMTAQPR